MNRTLSMMMLMLASAGAVTPALMANDYGIPEGIQQGNILHCFNWTPSQVKAELPSIAEAGYGSVQLSPCQRPDVSIGSSWHDLYRPYDLAFKSSSYCSEQDLKDLCTEAAKYGIKIIVDVVANHVDKTAGYHDTWWDSNNRVRWEGGIDYGNRYSITHGQLGDYGDVNSELSEVAARGKAYVEKLKELGVKGVRWDAAKHIGLPSEGCNFWSTVTSVPGMYHYGEILDSPGNDGLIKEYTQYMSVTDNDYCDAAAKNNGGIPGGYAGNWVVNQGCPDTKMVYWGESHDTYSNNDGWSKWHDQGNIDRAYAAFACRNGATALYLVRPDEHDFNSIKVGKGSNTSYKSKHIAEVNKFRNAMVGKADWFESNGNACSITRQNGGAVIVAKGEGYVNVTNGGGYCPVGTYKDRISGNTFTVTASTISGNVGESCIAVLYQDGVGPEPNPGPTPDPDPDPNPLPDPMPVENGIFVYFDNSDNWGDYINVYTWSDGTGAMQAGSWPGTKMVKIKDNIYKWTYSGTDLPDGVIFTNESGARAGGGNLKFVNGRTYYSNGLSKMVNQENLNPTPDPDPDPVPDPDPTPDPDDDIYVYFSNTGNWLVKAYAWIQGDPADVVSASWPGDDMVKIDGNLYKWTSTNGKMPTHIIFSNNGGQKAGDADLDFVNHATYYPDGSYVGGEGPTPGPTPDPTPVDAPESLYVIGNISAGAWNTAVGEPMELTEPGVFITKNKVTFEAAHTTDPNAYFSLTEKLGSDWDDLNNNADRFGPNSTNEEIALNQESAFKKFNKAGTASSCTSWKVRPGSYYVKANFKTGKLQLAETTSVDIVDVAEESDAVYFTLQGVRVENPEAGIYIKVTGNKATKVMVK